MSTEGLHVDRRVRSLFWLAFLLAAFTGTIALDTPVLGNRAFLTDFRAFYCAGWVRLSGNDPYRVEPLRRCEARALGIGQPPARGVVVPAPLPGFDLALFSLFARLPFATAAVLWEVLAVVAIGFSVVALGRLTGLEPEVPLAALLLSEGVASLFFGQLVPLSLAALIAAMLFASRDRPALAALCTTLAFVEPHIGIGAWLSLLFFAPRSRGALLVGAALLGGISVACNGVHGELEYVRAVVPAHVLSEIHNDDQYSFTYLASLLGAGDRAAAFLGSLSYVALLALGLVCARILAQHTREPALLIALPTALLLVGGPFVHVHQIAAALPAALLLYVRLPQSRFAFGAAAFLLAIPWIHIFLLLQFWLVLIGVVFVLSARLLGSDLLKQLCLAAVIFGSLVLANVLFTAPAVPPPGGGAAGNALAETVWRSYIDARHTSNRALFFALKLPTWLGLLLLTGNAARFALRVRGADVRSRALP